MSYSTEHTLSNGYTAIKSYYAHTLHGFTIGRVKKSGVTVVTFDAQGYATAAERDAAFDAQVAKLAGKK